MLIVGGVGLGFIRREEIFTAFLLLSVCVIIIFVIDAHISILLLTAMLFEERPHLGLGLDSLSGR